MSVIPSSDAPLWKRVIQQLSSYTSVGTGTFLFDLTFLWLLLFVFKITEPLAIGVAFLVAVHINYTILRLWTYRKSPEKLPRTYLYFIVFALIMTFLIPTLVEWLNTTFGLEVMVARIAVGTIIGLISFIYNSLLNFKLL